MKELERLTSEEQDIVLQTLLEHEQSIEHLLKGLEAVCQIILKEQERLRDLREAQFYNTVSIAIISIAINVLVWIW